MPSGTFNLKDILGSNIRLDGTLSVSGTTTLGGAATLKDSLSVAGGAHFAADTNTSNAYVGGTLSVSGLTTIGGHIIPSSNDTFDIGSPEFKIRDLYISDNSLWIGDESKISFTGGKMKFRRRKKDVVPQAVIDAAALAGHSSPDATRLDALAHAGVSSVDQMKLHHWQKYMRVFQESAAITDIFRDVDDDYDETTSSDAWKEISDTKIYTTTHVGIGTSDPDVALHIRGAIKVEDGFSLAHNHGSHPSVAIDTQNFGIDETVNDLTGMGSNKYTKLYRVYGTNSQGVGKNWYWGYANDDYTNFSLSSDGAGGNDPDIGFVFTSTSELHCTAVHAALSGNADTATRLQTARQINGVAFDGSADITIPIPDLNASKITAGTLPVSRGGTGTTTSTGTGSVVLSAAPVFTGDATFNTNTLKIDSTNGRVGIGTDSPQDSLHIFEASGGQTTGLFIEKQNGASGTAQVTFGVAASNEGATGKAKAGIFFERDRKSVV